MVKTSLEFYRRGKTYEVVVGYSAGRALYKATPRPELPGKMKEASADSAQLMWYGDFDKDGETEFIVSVLDCGAYCEEAIQVYRYDSSQDRYYVADQFATYAPAIQTYEDLNHDGNPELITKNLGFCYQCSGYTVVFSALTVMRYEQGRFRDVTKEFPALLQKDADNYLEDSRTDASHQGAGYITRARPRTRRRCRGACTTGPARNSTMNVPGRTAPIRVMACPASHASRRASSTWAGRGW